MKIAHLAPKMGSYSSAAWRVLEAQLRLGMDAEGLACEIAIDLNGSVINSPFVKAIKFLRFQRYVAAIKNKIFLKSKLDSPWSPMTGGVAGVRNTLFSNSVEIVNIHWIPSLVNLRKCASYQIPVVVTMHDVWSMTGGCHCNYGCNNWNSGCKLCPQKSSRFGNISSPESDLKSKIKWFGEINNLSFIGPSKWICDMAENSSVTSGRRVVHIPNPLNPEIFKPTANLRTQLPPSDSRKLLLLFVVAGEIDQFHKGFDLLVKIVNSISRATSTKAELLLVGESDGVDLSGINIPVHKLGVIREESEMARIYNSADILLHTSRQDNYPGTILEALSCGLRAIGFDVGGVSELINSGKFGRLVDAFDVEAYVKVLLEMAGTYPTMEERLSMHNDVMTDHHPRIIAEKYKRHYESCVENNV